MTLNENQFFCFSCRRNVTCNKKDIKVVVYENKRVGKVPALKCICPKCNNTLNKFIKRDSQEKMIKKYGRYKNK